ncbi:Arylsulphatase [Lichtheimia hyalospora FSU 10163]|nr:Arylsulphatase [Lichtheimia hyalospora FSU 10163]
MKALGLTALFLACTTTVLLGASIDHTQPNIIFIFTDDQDSRLDSLNYMPNVQKYLVQQGTVHKNHYATIAVCCPSRVGLLRGQYAHNTNITSVSPPHGGYDKFSRLGLGEDYLPLWMQEAGYSTHYIGKLMNGYNVFNYDSPRPSGFDYQDQLVDPFTYTYNTAVFSKNGEPPVYYNDTYQTDVIHAKALEALKAQRNADKPFFLWVAPMAPHGQFTFVNGDPENIQTEPPIPAARHADLFKDVKIPRTPHFNPINQTKTASYWKHLEHLTDEEIDALDNAYRRRLQALQAVDEMVGSLFEELEQQGKLDNTYVIYSADNGYHLGQHRAFAGKTTNIEEDINVPFLIRGPGVPKGHVSHVVSSHTDLAPTFLALAKGDAFIRDWIDGGVIPVIPQLRNHPKPVSKESFVVEFWMNGLMQNYPIFNIASPNTYKTLRVIAEDYNYKYSVWCTGEHELYDLDNDPYELHNLYDSGRVTTQLVDRLDALLSVLKSCRGHTCRDPWRVLHPDNPKVQTLADALHINYDLYYQRFRRVAFGECLDFYSAENEDDHVTGSTYGVVDNGFLTTHTNDQKQVVFTADETTSQCDGGRAGDVGYTSMTSEQVKRLFELVPQSSELIGHYVPSIEELNARANPVPEELTQERVDWYKYGFYNAYGN